MIFPESQLLLFSLQAAWIESLPETSMFVPLHSDCTFHVTSKAQCMGGGVVEPPIGQPYILDQRPLEVIDAAIHVHWFTHSFYHFSAEIVPKLIFLKTHRVCELSPCVYSVNVAEANIYRKR